MRNLIFLPPALVFVYGTTLIIKATSGVHLNEMEIIILIVSAIEWLFLTIAGFAIFMFKTYE